LLINYAHAILTGNTFAGRGLSLYRSGDILVAGNTFDVTEASGAGVTVALNSACGALRSLDCTKTGGSFPQPIISLGNRWNVTPTCPVATLEPGQ
jgi:hypothetical protein